MPVKRMGEGLLKFFRIVKGGLEFFQAPVPVSTNHVSQTTKKASQTLGHENTIAPPLFRKCRTPAHTNQLVSVRRILDLIQDQHANNQAMQSGNQAMQCKPRNQKLKEAQN